MSDDEASGQDAPRGGRVRGVVRRVSGAKGVEEELRALQARVTELETAHVRFAELLDLVQELVLPVAVRDEEKVRALVARYADELDPTYPPDEA